MQFRTLLAVVVLIAAEVVVSTQLEFGMWLQQQL